MPPDEAHHTSRSGIFFLQPGRHDDIYIYMQLFHVDLPANYLVCWSPMDQRLASKLRPAVGAAKVARGVVVSDALNVALDKAALACEHLHMM